jgi:2-polyprenyl-6-methoxyphenol hydroxylase-like FAD-dependent oxidoreductase
VKSGAYGLNGGIADVGSLRDCLVAMAEGKADDNILDMYDDVRREKWNTIINPRSQGMKKFIYSDPKVVIPGHPIYQMAMKMKESPEKLPPALPDLSLRYDFSKHFKDGEKQEGQPGL